MNKKINKFLKVETGYLCYAVFAFLLFVSFLLSCLSLNRASVNTEFLAFIVLLFSVLIWPFNYRVNNYRTCFQMSVLFGFFSLLWDSAIVSGIVLMNHKKLILVSTISLNLTAGFWLANSFSALKLKKSYLKKSITNNLSLLILLVIFFVLSLEILQSWLKHDTLIYAQTIRNASKEWDFTFNSLKSLGLAGHKSYAYTLCVLIGYYIFPNNGLGIRLISIIFALLTILAFYQIIKHEHKEASPFQVIIILSFFAFNPLFFGILGEVSLDFPTTCFFVFLVFAYRKKYYIFMMIFSIALCFSKEIGIILCLGFTSGVFLEKIFTKKMNITRLFHSCISAIIVGCGGIAWIVVYFLNRSLLWGSSTQLDGKAEYVEKNIDGLSVKLNSIDINIFYIIEKLKQFFCMNFIWILFALCFLVLFLELKKCKNSPKKIFTILKSVNWPIWIPFLLLFCFNLIYVTFEHYRYLQSFIVAYTYLWSWIVFKLSKKKKVLCLSSIVFICLIFVSNYVTIDPIMKLLFTNINVGDTSIITTRSFARESDNVLVYDRELSQDVAFLNGLSYNRQYLYYERMIEKAISSINYTSSDIILIPALFGEDTFAYLFLSGNECYWNKKTGNIYNDNDQISDVLLNIKCIYEETKLDNLTKYKHIYFFEFPFFTEKFDYSTFYKKNEIKEEWNISYRGWSMKIYEIDVC